LAGPTVEEEKLMAAITHEPLAVDGGPKTKGTPWPEWPVWGEPEERAIIDVLRSGQWWSVGGRKVTEFESAFARFQEAKHGIAVTNGTAALEVCLRALGIGCGDEVIVPPYTFIATASSVLAVGAMPVFVDIEPRTLNIDPSLIEPAVTPQTKAVIAVHIAGCPADMDGVMGITKKHNLYVIEDAAQAHAAEWKGRKVGAIGHLGTFSFQASKNLNAGEGGIVLSNDDDLADRVWSVHNVGRTKGGGWYEHPLLGGNFRMTEWQAAILLAQQERLPEQSRRRSQNAAYLTSLLERIPGITTLTQESRITNHAYHLYIFRYEPAAFGGRSRAEFIEALNAEGIPCSSGYVPLYKEKVFQQRAPCCPSARPIDYSAVHCPVCEQAARDAIWLPQTHLLADSDDMELIRNAVAKIQASWT
jgi:dTDP-4-amino-4,6-dideoxygalactose transaminase